MALKKNWVNIKNEPFFPASSTSLSIAGDVACTRITLCFYRFTASISKKVGNRINDLYSSKKTIRLSTTSRYVVRNIPGQHIRLRRTLL